MHLAVAAMRRGLNAAVLDTDPQQSSSFWFKTRNQRNPVVFPAQPNNMAETVELARCGNVDLLIVDTAPNAGLNAELVAQMANKILIPVRPSVLDISATQRTVEIVRRVGAAARFVLSACPNRSPEVKMARKALLATGLPVSDIEVGDRIAFSRALQTGRAVTEFEPQGKAAEEIEQLLDEILRLLRKKIIHFLMP